MLSNISIYYTIQYISSLCPKLFVHCLVHVKIAAVKQKKTLLTLNEIYSNKILQIQTTISKS